jgi:uncharacterized membrane protein
MKSSIRLYSFFTVLVALWCIGILAAPLLKHAGWTQSADMLYSFFSRVCHQDDARSFHVEGEKIGVCIRCSAIYFGFFLGLITLPLSRALKRKNVPAMGFFLFAVLPMVVDAVLNAAGIHASTPMTRVITGALFGISMPWFVVPIFIEACLQLNHRNKNHSPDSGVVRYDRKTQ